MLDGGPQPPPFGVSGEPGGTFAGLRPGIAV